MSDEADIARLLYTYARAVDTKDWELYRSVFTDDAHIDYSSAGAVVGSREEVAEWFAANFGMIPWSMHYVGDTAKVRAMFYNPMQLPGLSDPSYCGGYYHHELVRTVDGWRSRHLREENMWFVNSPAAAPPRD